MTDAHENDDTDGPHEGPIKTPKQLILAIFYAFVVPIFGIVLLVMFVTSNSRPGAGSDALEAKAVAERIRPVGVVEVKDMTDLASMKSGEQVFAGQCTACHSAGVLGAPKLGDASAWAPRIKAGLEALVHSALVGKGQMPAQGGGDFSDFEIARAVVYMANKGGAAFAEPVPPAQTAAASASAATATASAPTTTALAATAAAPALATASAAKADANAGTPIATATAGLNAQVREAVPTTAPLRPAPSATTAVATAAGGNAAPALYGQICTACHTAGVAGAPKLGDKAAWAPRIAQGIDALTASAIKGKGAMPPKGGSAASEADIKAVVTYMVNSAK